jgi:hypothetical protein
MLRALKGPMLSEDLVQILGEFARTMVTDFPIQGILGRLVGRIVDVLPVTAGGVTLIAPELGPQYVAASNASALRYEQLQTELGKDRTWRPMAATRRSRCLTYSSRTAPPSLSRGRWSPV